MRNHNTLTTHNQKHKEFKMKHFYQVTFKHLVEEEKPGKKGETVIVQKKKSGCLLVCSLSCAEAERIANKLKTSLVDFKVEKVVKTKITNVTDGADLNIELNTEIEGEVV